MSLLKIPVLLLTAYYVDVSVTRQPSAPPPEEERVVSTSKRERAMMRLALPALVWVIRPYAWIPAIVETLSIMAAHNLLPRALQIRLPRLLSAGGSTFRITPSFAAGAALAIMGARFRLAAYRALGTNFKYHLSVLRDHRLATTGPYARVRHPSYTGCFAAYLGVNTAWAARAGWLRGAVWPWLVRDAGTLARVATGAAASAVLGQQLLAVLGLLRRMGEEDGMMRTRFGTEWEEWAARVPYKLISGVY